MHNHLLGGGFGRRLEVDSVTRAVQIAKQVEWAGEGGVDARGGRPARHVPTVFLRPRERRSGRPGPARGMESPHHRLVDPEALGAPAFYKEARSRDDRRSGPAAYALPNILSTYVNQSRRFPPRSGAASGRRTTSSSSRASSTNSPRRRSRTRWPTAARCWRTERPRRCCSLPPRRRAGGGRCPQVKAAACRCSSRSAATWRRSPKSRSPRTAASRSSGSSVRSIAASSSIPTPSGADARRGHLRHLRACSTARSTLKNGRIEQSNFHDVQVLRINEAPSIESHIVQNTEAPGGMGEAGTSALHAGGHQRDLCRDRQAAAQAAGRPCGVEAAGMNGCLSRNSQGVAG